MVYRHRPETLNVDSARQSTIEAKCSDRGIPFPCGKGDEAAEDTRRSGGPSQREAGERSEPARRDRLGEVAASPNSKFQADGGIVGKDVKLRHQSMPPEIRSRIVNP